MRIRSTLISLALCATPAVAQDTGTPLEIGRSHRVTSRVLGEARTIDVTLPAGYERNTDRRYPLLLVLDGEFKHQMTAAVALEYAATSQVPQMVIVSVRNTNRNRDLTPAPANGFRAPPEAPQAGGAERFLAFLGDELVPHLERQYRLTPMRVLIGHSLAGEFALYALARRPELFLGYIVMEPSTWWNRGQEFEEARAILGTPAARRIRFIGVNMQDFGRDTTAWGGSAPMIRTLIVSGETHASMGMSGVMLALRTMFADFKPSEWRPGTRPIAMLERYDSLAHRIGYAVPIPSSAFSTVTRMSIDARYYDDAERALMRWERELGISDGSRAMRDKLNEERAAPPPGRFVQLEIPARRPKAADARGFLGRWRRVSGERGYEVEIRASGDTITVFDRTTFPDGTTAEGYQTVVQLTADGTLEWGRPVFRGLAALLVMQARIEPDGSMSARYEPRGWIPREPGTDFTAVDRLERVR